MNHMTINHIDQINGRPLFHNTPPWVPIDKRMCLVKTLLGKILWDKNLVKEKEYIILYNIVLYIFYFSPSCKHTSLRGRNPILWTNCSNVLLDKDFVNKSARFSYTNLLDLYITISLKIMSEKEFWENMLCSVFFNISFFQLSDACTIIFIYGCWFHFSEDNHKFLAQVEI